MTPERQAAEEAMAQRYAEAGRPASLGTMLFSPAAMFLKMFVAQRGFLDGQHGFVLATLFAYYTFLKYAKLWEFRRKAATPSNPPCCR